MGNEFGRNYRVNIGDGADPEVFAAIGGETSLDWSRASQEIDLSDKDSGIYGSASYGQQRLTFKLSGNLKLPDAPFTLLETASKASPPQVNIEIKSGAVVKFKGLVAVGNMSASFPTQGAATYTADMINVGVPTTDDLSASS